MSDGGSLPAGLAGRVRDGAAERLRGAVRRLATGVTVLTVAEGGTAHGTTVSAVAVVSRDPLLVCACLRRGSRFAELVRARQRFVVNVLSGRQALVADWFANPDRPAGLAQFVPVDWRPHQATGAPLLCHALAWLGCRLTEVLPGGDHEVLLAEVVEGAAAPGNPLIALDGRLHGVELLEVGRHRWRHPADAGATALE